MILIIVLVVVVLLALGAYTFSEFMITEAQAAHLHGQMVQARALADSGVELVASQLADRVNIDPVSLYNSPQTYRGMTLREDATGQGRFTVIAAIESDPAGQTVRYGLIDESARLNLNLISKLKLGDKVLERELLMYLPGMDIETADSLLDWVDADDEPREFGAESSFYQGMSPAYFPKNGPVDSLDELLLVKGVTPMLLFGEDANRNGLLDPNENDGSATLPLDNGDGQLDRGWSAYLTVTSRERNLRIDGADRIFVNENILTDLYDQLTEELGEDVAKFVVAYRLAGPAPVSNSATGPGAGSGGGGSGSSSSSGNSPSSGGSRSPPLSGGSAGTSAVSSALGSGSTSAAGSGTPSIDPTALAGAAAAAAAAGGSGAFPSGGSRSVNATGQQGLQQLAAAVGRAVAGSPGGSTQPVTRGGMDLSKGAKFTIDSLYDLIGAQVKMTVSGTPVVLESPWSDDAQTLTGYLPQLIDTLTITEEHYIEGRINVNQSAFEVLRGIPDMTEELARNIVSAQMSAGGSVQASGLSDRATTGWLVAQGLVDLPTMRKLDKYLTARGDVYRVQVVGFFDRGGPTARVEAVIDASQDPPTILSSRDLTELGRSFPPAMLGTASK